MESFADARRDVVESGTRMTTPTKPDKPLGIKAYGSIAHLPGSRLGPGDHRCHEGQARIATEKPRDRHDRVIVTEKLDGSNVAVAKIDGEIVPLIRAGYRARDGRFEQHLLFHDWAMANAARFEALQEDGERAIGEWLAQAHGTRYDLCWRAGEAGLPDEPFVLFDIMRGHERLPWDEITRRVAEAGAVAGPPFALPLVLSDGPPMSIEAAMAALSVAHGAYFGGYGALDAVEGAVWRVERRGAVDFLVKYVRHDKQDGNYLPEISGGEAIWNWRPADPGEEAPEQG
jgi:hypothetical protein